MYRLYWAAGTGAIAPEVMLEQAGVPFERVVIDLVAGEHREPDYLAINPTGEVPALQLPDGTMMTESAAMVLLLGERYPRTGLVPPPDDPERPRFLRWLLYLAAAVYPMLARMNHPERFAAPSCWSEPDRSEAIRCLDRQFGLVGDAIAGKPWFLPSGYGALDVYLTMLAGWHPEKDGMLARNSALAELVSATEVDTVYARVMERHRMHPP
ncbi:glutathione S-transferase family protein [Halofilum ochraceum]|uniref:glutathione S-transferase family protein n=1 Tax=Halofilum ochraceum TaxID=1611323 RepID=UPI0008D90A64|nr:glutathione S-transferase [Halofilum ochraceum]